LDKFAEIEKNIKELNARKAELESQVKPGTLESVAIKQELQAIDSAITEANMQRQELGAECSRLDLPYLEKL